MPVEIRELVLRANVTNEPDPAPVRQDDLRELRLELRSELETRLREVLRNQRER